MAFEDKTIDEITLNYFQTTSRAFFSNINYEDYSIRMKRTLGPWLEVKGYTTLDLGCGTGELCWMLKDSGAATVVGVNACQEEIDVARKNVDANFIVEDILSYLKTLPDASVDRIYALNILEHFSKDYLLNVLLHCSRVLRPGGSVTAIVPNATSPFGGMTRYWDLTHLLALTPSSVQQLKVFCGFRDAQFRELGPRPHGFVSLTRYILWRAIRYMIMFRLLVETASIKGGIYTADMAFRLIK